MMTMLNSFSGVLKERGDRRDDPPKGDTQRSIKIETQDLCFFYGNHQALFDVSLAIPERSVMALIGPSGCGKSTFLRTLNRMNEIIEGTRLTGPSASGRSQHLRFRH